MVIKSAEDNEKVRTLGEETPIIWLGNFKMSRSSFCYNEYQQQHINYNLGLYDASGNNKDWRWPDGTIATYTNWKEGEPDDYQEMCVTFYVESGKWNDAACNSKWYCACQDIVDPGIN